MPSLVGILNVTPDSFSDGGKFDTIETALSHARALVEQGASVIDVGAESTRPGAKVLTPEEEWKRAGGILSQLTADYRGSNICISFDTRHYQNADKALTLGVNWINDVSGADTLEMRNVLRDADGDVQLVVMHHLGIPADKQKIVPENENVVDVVLTWAKHKLEQLDQAGIASSQVILDPGIGFGKNATQSLKLIKEIEQLHDFGAKILVGHSRKSFLTPFYGDNIDSKDEGTLLTSAYLASKKVQYLRVHNVEMHQKGLALAEKLFMS